MKSVIRKAAPAGAAWVFACAFALGLVLTTGVARAEADWGEEYARRIKAAQQVAPLGDDAFGDNISLYTGAVTFTATDVSIPGNNALPVALTRVYVPSESHNPGILENNSTGLESWPLNFPNMFEDWQLDVPHISAVYPLSWSGGWNGLPPAEVYDDGLTFRRQDYWDGSHFHYHGSSSELLALSSDPKRLQPEGFQPTLGTKDGWVFVNLTGTPPIGPRDASGNLPGGFTILGYDPQGNKYYFNWLVERDHRSVLHPYRIGYLGGTDNLLRRKELILYVTRVEDRFGNSVDYTWEGSHVTRVRSSDGRQIDLEYTAVGLNNAYVSKVRTSTGREWKYEYMNQLRKVINPDLSTWEYARDFRLDMIEYEKGRDVDGYPYTLVDENVPCSPAGVFKGTPHTYSIKHPAGATATYTFKPTRHGRTNVIWRCLGTSDGNERSRTGTYQDVMSLQSKTITGPGLPAGMTYTYSYAGLEAGYQAQDESVFPFEPGWNARWAPPVPNYKTTTVTQPDGVKQVYTFGKDWEVNEGQLLETKTVSGTTVVKTVTNTYVTDTEAATLPFPAEYGSTLVPFGDRLPGYFRPLKSTVTSMDGVTFTSKVAVLAGCNNNYCFDQQARATVSSKFSSLGYQKFEGVEYYDDREAWVLNLVQASTVNGVETARTDFDPVTALPVRTYAYGKLQQTLTYNSDGTLKTAANGNGNVTTLSSWYRGVPRLIRYPATPENTAGATEAATVNDDGMVTTVDDEGGSRTCYAYDSMLRLKEVTYTSESAARTCTSTDWSKTYQSMMPLATAEFGLSTAQWRQRTRTGNGEATTYFDALWRPVLTLEQDLANTSTRRASAIKYDAMGRVASAFYPKAGEEVDDLADFTLGTHTTYDSLGRVTRVEQDSELGRLVTSTAYLSGFQRRITNPEGAVTTQKFQVFDVPSYDLPVQIDAPLNTRTTIVRDMFGKPLELNRGPGS